MKKELLQQIARTAYNVGFGAKKHFATYDMVEKLPGIIEFLSISIGILALVFDIFNVKCISAMLIIAGIGSIYISKYDKEKDSYNETGKELLSIFEEMEQLYSKVKIKNEDDGFVKEEEKLKELKEQFHCISISKQILFSDAFAHCKFFWEYKTKIKWIQEEIKLNWTDKIPLCKCIFIMLGILFFIVICFICN